nr:hypothetical protein [Tanacetum cinerariifolium]
ALRQAGDVRRALLQDRRVLTDDRTSGKVDRRIAQLRTATQLVTAHELVRLRRQAGHAQSHNQGGAIQGTATAE